MRPSEITDLENEVATAALTLGQLEEDEANEWLRLAKFQHVRDWEATQLAKATYAGLIREAQAVYEIAVAALRRAQ